MPKEVDSKEEEEEEEEFEEEEEEDDGIEIFVGVASTSVADQGDFFAKFGGSSDKHDCLECKAKQTVVEACSVSAPFADLAKREVIVCVCQSCNKFTVLRKQEKLAVAAPTPKKKEGGEENKPLLFDESPVQKETSMDELEALLLASSVSKPNKPKKPSATKKPSSPTTVPSLQIAFYPEPGLEQEDFSHEAMLLAAYNKEAKELGEDVIEADHGAFSSFETFFERLAREPQQLLRYAYGSKPLWPTSTNAAAAAKIPPCESCQAARLFEFQLTPQAVSEFQRYSNCTVEWSSILVFSCEASCDSGTAEHCIACPVI